ncbi:MAG: AzlC family ABC transporter permease [Lutispora sp.]|uniref:AzlC family ABC transporter permease n=1 Tax=Lutispora sp. TaxID=2828727 RepID=UPI003564E7B2
MNKGTEFKDGLRAAIPIGLGYIPIAIAFGILSKASKIPNTISIMLSSVVFAGSSQFVGVNMLTLGATTIEIVMTTFILNFRHFLMSASLSQRVDERTSKRFLSLLAFGITDETFSLASMREEKKISPYFQLGLNVMAFFSWNAGTWLGLLFGTALPDTLQNSMGIAIYCMFLGLLLPSMKKSRPILVVAAISMVIHSLLKWIPMFAALSSGLTIIIATIGAASLGTIFFPQGVED